MLYVPNVNIFNIINNSILNGTKIAIIAAITIKGPKGSIQRVRILGPERSATQAEISKTDSFLLCSLISALLCREFTEFSKSRTNVRLLHVCITQ